MNYLEKSAIDGLNELVERYAYDPEALHGESEEILLKFLKDSGHEELVKTYVGIQKKYGFWYA